MRVHRGLSVGVLLRGVAVMERVAVAKTLSVPVPVPVGVSDGRVAVGSPEAVGAVAV